MLKSRLYRWSFIPKLLNPRKLPPTPRRILCFSWKEETHDPQARLTAQHSRRAIFSTVLNRIKHFTLLHRNHRKICSGRHACRHRKLVFEHELDRPVVRQDKVHRLVFAGVEEVRVAELEQVLIAWRESVGKRFDEAGRIGEDRFDGLAKLLHLVAQLQHARLELFVADARFCLVGEEDADVGREETVYGEVLFEFGTEVGRSFLGLAMIEVGGCGEPLAAELGLSSRHDAGKEVEANVPGDDFATGFVLHDGLGSEEVGEDLEGGFLVAEKIDPVAEEFLCWC